MRRRGDRHIGSTVAVIYARFVRRPPPLVSEPYSTRAERWGHLSALAAGDSSRSDSFFITVMPGELAYSPSIENTVYMSPAIALSRHTSMTMLPISFHPLSVCQTW